MKKYDHQFYSDNNIVRKSTSKLLQRKNCSTIRTCLHLFFCLPYSITQCSIQATLKVVFDTHTTYINQILQFEFFIVLFKLVATSYSILLLHLIFFYNFVFFLFFCFFRSAVAVVKIASVQCITLP